MTKSGLGLVSKFEPGLGLGGYEWLNSETITL